MNLNKLLVVALEGAKLGADVLVKYQRKLDALHVEHKTAAGFVSEADRTSEKKIFAYLRKMTPDFEFFGEESSYLEHSDEAFFQKAEWCWCVDPLDGTHNYLNRLDLYSVSVALLHYGEPVIGVVIRPAVKEIYYTVEGKKSYFVDTFGKRHVLQVKSKKALKDSMLVTGFSSEKGILKEVEIENFKKFVSTTHGIRRLGSAALDLCFVARGLFDAHFELSLEPYDTAAGALIAKNAGAKVTSFDLKKFNPFKKSIICGIPTVVRDISKRVSM